MAQMLEMFTEMASAPITGMHNLPYDALFYIFSYLPIPDLARCALVCKQWHEIVTGYTHLWKRKRYLSNRTPTECNETYAVLRALPPLEEVVVKAAGEFVIDIFYPRLVLLVTDVSDLGSEEDGPRLKCAYLSARVDVAVTFLTSRSTLDVAALQKLRIVRTIPSLESFDQKRIWEMYPRGPPLSLVDDAIAAALERCPNLRKLCVYAEFLSEEKLDASDGIRRLRSLEIECPGLENLIFLRRCSDALEELELKGCADLSSAEYAELRSLGKLRRLCLRDCCVEPRDMEVAAPGLARLESLHLDCCDRVSDLSCLRYCDRLRELRVKASPPDAPLTGLRVLPGSLRLLHLAGNAIAADELAEVAPRLPHLEQLRLIGCELPHLRFLRYFPQLRWFSLEFSCWPDGRQLALLRYMKCLEVLDLTRCWVDADILCRVMPFLPRLDFLSLSHAEDVSHLRFLRHCRQLRTLSLYYTYGLEMEAYRELCQLTDLQRLHISDSLRSFVDEVLRPCLPQLKVLYKEVGFWPFV